MSRYLVTGATGLIGRELTPRLLRRGGEVVVLVRPATAARSGERFDAWRELASASGGRLIVAQGDVVEPGFGAGLGDAPFDHLFHLAAIYDLDGDPEAMERVNVGGTRNLLALLTERSFNGTLHLVSSIAVAGDYDGEFPEDELDKGQGHPHPYLRSKYDSERLVREQSGIRYRIYRPSAVVGHSRTGEMDRVDGPYYLFKPILKLRNALPPWVPLVGGLKWRVNMVPVDFVADAIDHLAHADGWDGRCFHVVDPAPPHFSDTFNLIAAAAGAPQMSFRVGGGLLKMLPGAGHMLTQLGSVKFFRQQLAKEMDIPVSMTDALNRKVTYETKNLIAGLEGSGLRCPEQREYIEKLWDYWLRNLDPDRDPEALYRHHLTGKNVLITGASSGIGEELAVQCAALGARVLLVARRAELLEEIAKRVRTGGGEAAVYAADLSEMGVCDDLVKQVLAEHERVDILVNNAGRSIRRHLHQSIERFHDFERVMRLNFFAALRLIRGFMPGMRERGQGHIVNVLTAGVVLPTPLFGAYGASKAALSHLTDTLAVELMAEGVNVTGVYLPFVRTPMMSSEHYDENTRAMTAERAARWMIDGIVRNRRRIIPGEYVRRAMLHDAMPQLFHRVMNLVYRIYGFEPGEDSPGPDLTLDRMLIKRFIKGRVM